MKRVMPVVLWSLLSVLLMAMLVIGGCASTAAPSAPAEREKSVDAFQRWDHGSASAPSNSVQRYYVDAHGIPAPNAAALATPALKPAADPSALAAMIDPRCDEVWVIQRSSRDRVRVVTSPGTGTIVVVNVNEPADAWPTWKRLPVVSTGVHAEITGQLAAVKVEQSFTNPNEYPIEAAYAFPLPDDAAVSDFVMTIGDRHIRGIVREREEAKQIYEAAKAQGLNAALLEQERPNIFLQRVANIAAGATIGVEITYYNTLPCVEGWCELVLPTTIGPRYTPAGQTPPVEAKQIGVTPRVSIGVDIDAGVPIGKVECESHTVEVVRPSRTQAFARLGTAGANSERDFLLRWNIRQSEATGTVYTTSDANGGYFAMQLVPPESSRGLDPRPVDIVFVLDRSGSMSGWPLQIAKNTITRGIDALRHDERFQIVDFSESVSGLGTKLLPPTGENRAAAKRYLESTPAQGGTQMRAGLEAALAIPEEPGRRKVIAFLTDGFIGNERDVLSLVHKGLGGAKIFAFGIGGRPNRFLINELAALGHGVSAWATDVGDGLPAMDAFIETVRRPALTDVRVSFGGSEARVEDAQVPTELYPGRGAFITGRFIGQVQGTVVVTARANGRPVSFEVPVKQANANAAVILPKLWARGQMTAMARRELRGEAVDAVAASRSLALEHGLVSPYTSFIAVDAAGAMK